MDSKKNGYVTKADIHKILKGHFDQATIDEIFSSLDLD